MTQFIMDPGFKKGSFTNSGCVVEHSDVNKDPEEVKNHAVFMVKEMMKVRNMEIKEMIIEKKTHIVENQGSVVAAIVYLE